MAVKVDDVELIKSFQAGDPNAFTNVVSQHRERLFRHAMRRLGSVQAAEDAVQETFFRAYRAFDRLHDDSRIGPWLHHILGNVCIDEANRRQRDFDKSARASSDPFNTPLAPGIEEQLGLDADGAPVRRALDTLPDSYQQALTMRFVDELTYDEMAVTSGTSEENARARVSRARTAMRAALRGVAVVPVFVLGLTRRGSRSAAALEKVDHVHKASTASEGAIAASKVATSLAPAIETANAMVVSLHHSAPLMTKAALGIGAVALATMSAGPERPPVPIPSVVPAIIGAAESVELRAATPAAPTPVAAAAAPVTAAAAPVVPSTVAEVVEPASAEMADTPATPETVAPVKVAVPVTTAAPAVVAPVVTEPPVIEAPIEAPVEVVVHGGSVRIGSMSITPSGPRLDVSGQVTVTVAGAQSTGSFSGRLAIADDVDSSGRQRLEGVATLVLDDGSTLELRLAGHAVGLDDLGEGTASTFSLSGQFRLSGAAALSLAEAGTFSGTLTTSTLGLDLSP